MSTRFAQFSEADIILQFFLSPHTLHTDNLELSNFEWICLSNLEMELKGFEKNVTWKIQLNMK